MIVMKKNRIIPFLLILVGAAAHVSAQAFPDNFARVDAGSFNLLPPQQSVGVSASGGACNVTLTHTFYISRFEVSQGSWQAVMGTNPSAPNKGIGAGYPVNNVSWFDAVEYCNKRSIAEGLAPAYTISGSSVTWNKEADGYRLPTSAEWEYAARGGKWSKGFLYSGSNNIRQVGWYFSNSGAKIQPVARLKANELGIYDMTGNLWEWCWDREFTYPGGSVTDPSGPDRGDTRVIRGGAWDDYALHCQNDNPVNMPASFAYYIIGFRIVRNAD